MTLTKPIFWIILVDAKQKMSREGIGFYKFNDRMNDAYTALAKSQGLIKCYR